MYPSKGCPHWDWEWVPIHRQRYFWISAFFPGSGRSENSLRFKYMHVNIYPFFIFYAIFFSWDLSGLIFSPTHFSCNSREIHYFILKEDCHAWHSNSKKKKTKSTSQRSIMETGSMEIAQFISNFCGLSRLLRACCKCKNITTTAAVARMDTLSFVIGQRKIWSHTCKVQNSIKERHQYKIAQMVMLILRY